MTSSPKKDSPAATSGDPSSSDPSRDVVLIHGRTEDSRGLKVLRARDGAVELGEVRPVAEGQPLHHDLVRLKPRPGLPFVCDVETTYRAQKSAPTQDVAASPRHPGPARVATPAYRSNWDAIWAKKSEPSDSNLN